MTNPSVYAIITGNLRSCIRRGLQGHLKHRIPTEVDEDEGFVSQVHEWPGHHHDRARGDLCPIQCTDSAVRDPARGDAHRRSP